MSARNIKEHGNDKLYVHYGSAHFERSRFKAAQNRQYESKPKYGLWGSPIDAEYSWKQWCEDNEYGDIDKKECFYFRLEGFQVYEIVKAEDIEKLPFIELKEEHKNLFGFAKYFLDFERIRNADYPYFALDIKIREVEDLLLGYDCDCVLVLDDCCLVENYDAKIRDNPITLRKVLPIRGFYKRILQDIDVCYLGRTPDDELYVYCEQPDAHYCFRTLLACISDGRIVETCGYTKEEAEVILQEILKDKEELSRLILEKRLEISKETLLTGKRHFEKEEIAAMPIWNTMGLAARPFITQLIQENIFHD